MYVSNSVDLLFSLAWKSVLVLMFAGAIALVLHSRSAALRHMVWTTAFGALLLLPVFSVLLPALRVPAEAPIGALLATASATDSASGAARVFTRIAQTKTVQPASPTWIPAPRTALAWIWAAGTLVCLVRLLAAWFAVLRLRRTSHRWLGNDAEAMTRSLGMGRMVEVLSIAPGAMPASFGNAVFLPSDASAWDEPRRRAVLLHELAHVRRADSTIQLGARVALSLYWWNPLAWTAWRALIETREQAADDLVLEAGVGPSDYASHLMELARSMRSTRLIEPAMVGMARQSNLEARLMAILDAKRDRRVPGRMAALCLTAAALLLIAPMAAVRAQEPEDFPADVDAMMRAAVIQRNAGALENMAMRAADLAKYDVGMKLMKSALEVRAQTSGEQSKEYGKSLLKLGRLQWRSGDDASRQTFTKALELLGDQPESADALIQLALAELSVKNYDGAVRLLEKAVPRDPKSAARATMWLGVVREKQGRMEDAAFLYRDALGLAETQSEEAATILELHSQMLKQQNKTEESDALQARASAIRGALDAAAASKRTANSLALKIGGDVKSPSVLYKIEPIYSQEARLARYQGAVKVAVEIAPDGSPQNVRVVRGLGLGLSEKAIEAIQKWKFRPGLKNGDPVRVMATIEVNFRLM